MQQVKGARNAEENKNGKCKLVSQNSSRACCHEIAFVSERGNYPVLANSSVFPIASENTKHFALSILEVNAEHSCVFREFYISFRRKRIIYQLFIT